MACQPAGFSSSFKRGFEQPRLRANAPLHHVSTSTNLRVNLMKSSMTKYSILIATTCVAGILLSGCAWSIGDKKDGCTPAQATRGQELIDLKKAKDQGAITEEEYQAQKKRLLEK